MRHTLLPLHERKSLRIDYYMRLFITFFSLVSVAGVVGIGALFPAYIHALVREQEHLTAAQQLKRSNDESGQTDIENQLRADNAILKRFTVQTHAVRASAAIASIVALRGTVRITSFVFGTVSTTTVSVMLQGKAPTRADLLAFKSRLENILPAGKTELPISALAKSTDVVFTMNLNFQSP